MQGEVEGRAVQAAVLARGQVVTNRAVEAGIPVGLVEPQVEGAGERLQARGLPDGADGHVALWETGGRRGGQPAGPRPGCIPRRAAVLRRSPVFTSKGTSSGCPFRYHVIWGAGFPLRLLQVAI